MAWAEKWRTEWSSWWRNASLRRKLAPAAVVLAYWLALLALGGFRSDHVAIGGLVLALSYAGPRAKPLFQFLLPILLTGTIYDSQRFYSDYIRGRIHVDEPYLFDKVFFGISTPQGIQTPNEWWQLHTHPALDFVTGFFYLTFIAIFVGIAAYFRFYLSRKGTARLPAAEISARAPRMMWAFFWVNMIGYSTYYWYAAAPPWYVALYGLGPADLSTPANPAGCIRFDQLLGTNFFTGMYGRSADVFGAIPSLHIAYPLQAVWYAFQFGSLRVFSVFFYLIMCFSAVYLNHHYMLDLIWGSVYALLVNVAVDRYFSRLKLNQHSQNSLLGRAPVGGSLD